MVCEDTGTTAFLATFRFLLALVVANTRILAVDVYGVLTCTDFV